MFAFVFVSVLCDRVITMRMPYNSNHKSNGKNMAIERQTSLSISHHGHTEQAEFFFYYFACTIIPMNLISLRCLTCMHLGTHNFHVVCCLSQAHTYRKQQQNNQRNER